MNIVKFKDIYLDKTEWQQYIDDSGQIVTNPDYKYPGECPYTDDEIEFFNTNLKSRYAYTVNWKWVVPFSGLTIAEYIDASQSNEPGTDTYIDLDKVYDLVDHQVTDRVNSVTKYEYLNRFSSDADITLDELKRFRTWLAETLLNIKYSEDMVQGEREMLSYYAGGMYDSAIANLSLFSTVTPQYSVIGSSSCGCVKPMALSQLTVGTSTCDPIYIYRRGIYDFMVNLWSVNTYWMNLESEEFLSDFKRYIDGIISYNLPLYTSDWTTVFNDCNCLNSSDSLQNAGIAAMKNLSVALGYMISGDVAGHKTFIDNALRVFTTQYYEMMYWA